MDLIEPTETTVVEWFDSCRNLSPPDHSPVITQRGALIPGTGLHGVVAGCEIHGINGRLYMLQGPDDLDYIGGAHWLSNLDIPFGQIWMDDRIDLRDWPFLLVHELAELWAIAELGERYEEAHKRYGLKWELFVSKRFGELVYGE